MTTTMDPSPTAIDRDIEKVNSLKTLYTQARNAKRMWYENWERNYRLVHNRQKVKAAQAWMPVPRDSEIYPACATIVAWAADQNTSIEYIAAADPGQDFYDIIQNMGNDLTTIVKSNWSAFNYTAQIKLAIWDALIYSVGFFKTVWDQALDGGLGNVMLKRVDPWTLYVDPNATSLEDAEYVIEARRMTMDEVRRRWPETAHLVNEAGSSATEIDSRPDRTDTATTQGVSNLGNLLLGSSTRWNMPRRNQPMELNGKDTIVVYEFWVKVNDKWEDSTDPNEAQSHVQEKWRVTVVAANSILMDEDADDLWNYGGHPYDRLVWDDIGEFYGISIVDHLSSPQIYINRLLTALQHSAELTANPVFIEPTNAGTDRVGIINQPGQRLKINPAAMQTPPQWLNPPGMSGDVQKLVEFWISRSENISGMSAVAKGSMLTGAARTPEGVINTIQEAAFVRIRSGLQNLEGTLKSVAAKMADLIIDNFNEARYVACVGPNGEQTSKMLTGNHFQLGQGKAMPLKYAVNVDAGAASPTSRQVRMAEADMAMALGAIDSTAWLEAHNYPNRQAIAQRVAAQTAVGAFQPPGARQRAGRTK